MVYNEIMKIENIHSLAVEQKQRKYNTTPTFTGFNINNAIKVSQSTVDKFVKKAGMDLHLDVPTNKNAFAYLTDKFKYDDRSKVLAAYQSCMDSSGKVNQAATSHAVYKIEFSLMPQSFYHPQLRLNLYTYSKVLANPLQFDDENFSSSACPNPKVA